MTNSKNLENMNAEVQTTEEQETVVVGVPQDEPTQQPPTEDVKKDDSVADIPEEDNPDNAESDEVLGGPADEEAEQSEEKPSKEKMSKREKITLFAILILLIALLVWGTVAIINGLQRDGDPNGLDGSGLIITGQTDGTDSDNSTTDTTSDNKGSNSDADEDGDDNRDHGNNQQGTTDDGKKDDSDKDKPDGTTSDTSGDTDTTSKPDDTDKDKDDTDKDDDTDQGGTQDKPDTDTVADYTGDTTVRVAKVDDTTGIINITIDGITISVPVQTTYFNGRVTKTGVAQAKLFGYNSGVTVLLYYPQADGFVYNEVTGYMSRTEDGLTVLVDINGEGAKLLIKVNGMKALF